MNVNNLMAELERKHPGENEYLQAVREVLESIEEVYNQHPEFEKAKIVERLVEPDRIFTFRVTWVDDKGEVQTNLGLPRSVQQRDRSLQRRFAFPQGREPFDAEVPRFRADFQERPDDPSDGWCKGWFGLRSDRQVER